MSVKQMLSGLPAGGQKVKAAVLTTSLPVYEVYTLYWLTKMMWRLKNRCNVFCPSISRALNEL